jgi:mannose/fructose/N-acetylgalactosamine-specific phosphotransferase system component IIB
MPISLLRVDERLIHGQVTLGWGTQLRPARYLVVDDALAGSAWEQDLHRLGSPPGVEVLFLCVGEALARLAALLEADEVTVLLTRDLPTMARLGEGGALAGREVNLGGIHEAPGRERVLPYLALGDPELAAIEQLQSDGARVIARDLPGAIPVPVGFGAGGTPR